MSDYMDESESSTTIEERKFLHPDEKNVQIFAKQMLKSRIFFGHFQEKRYVEPLRTYRDVIVIKDTETELKDAIEVVLKRVRGFYKSECWIGMMLPGAIGAPEGYSLWVQSQCEKFGRYLFKIRDVRFCRNEVTVKVKILREICDSDLSDNSMSIKNVSELFESIAVENVKLKVANALHVFFTDVLTARNIVETVKFISVLLVTSISLSVKGIGFFMEFLLKFMREISVFIHASTPVMLAIVNFFGRVVGGFYFLIAMIWRDSTQGRSYTAIPSRNYRAIAPPDYDIIQTPRYRAITSSVNNNSRNRRSGIYSNYGDRSPLTITEIE